jgi:uncharacterized phage protein (TIGR02220 family)|tara:strand:+ start:1606 stop:2253 length:648 start_codon:yes stop_codon:yes gene_type:complete
MKFLYALSKRPENHQLLWVYLIGEVEAGNYIFEPNGLRTKYQMSNSTLKRVIAWGIQELNQERVVYRVYWQNRMVNISLGEGGYIAPKKKLKVEDEEVIKTPSVLPEVIEIIEYLNQSTGKHFKPKSKNAQRHISARLKEGYVMEDFKKVIDVKSAKWIGTSMEQFIRPETLFGSKFDGYLNESGIQNEQQSKFITTQRAVDEAKQFDFFGNKSK